MLSYWNKLFINDYLADHNINYELFRKIYPLNLTVHDNGFCAQRERYGFSLKIFLTCAIEITICN